MGKLNIKRYIDIFYNFKNLFKNLFEMIYDKNSHERRVIIGDLANKY